MPVSLPDVTLCAVTSVNHELTVRAINQCLRHCSFADVVMVSSQPIEAPFRVEVIPPFPDGMHYAPFICQNLKNYTPSAFNLLVQYDGYISEPSAWTDKFLDYDYIGAKWPWHPPDRRVGNSGFCLRSKRLLEIISEMPLPERGTYVDDEFICHTMRDRLENDHDIKIAPDEVADLFAYERHVPHQPTFGFHGMFNFCRHVDDAEMIKIPALLETYYITSRPFVEVMFYYFSARKFPVFISWYNRLREQIGQPQIANLLLSFVNKPEFIHELIEVGETTRRVYGMQ